MLYVARRLDPRSVLGIYVEKFLVRLPRWQTWLQNVYGSSANTGLSGNAAHSKCMSLTPLDNIENAIAKQLKESEVITTRMFRTAYYAAKEDRPYSDYETLLQLQKLNGLDTGITLQSRYSGNGIIAHIAK